MADIFDFSTARERHVHKRKEAKVRALRRAFKAARESWDPKTRRSRLKQLLKNKRK